MSERLPFGWTVLVSTVSAQQPWSSRRPVICGGGLEGLRGPFLSHQSAPSSPAPNERGDTHTRWEKASLLPQLWLGNQQGKCCILNIFYSICSWHPEQTLVFLQSPAQPMWPEPRGLQGPGNSPPRYCTSAVSLRFSTPLLLSL